MASCENCGKALAPEARFCASCGKAVATTGPGAQPVGPGQTPQPRTHSEASWTPVSTQQSAASTPQPQSWSNVAAASISSAADPASKSEW